MVHVLYRHHSLYDFHQLFISLGKSQGFTDSQPGAPPAAICSVLLQRAAKARDLPDQGWDQVVEDCDYLSKDEAGYTLAGPIEFYL